MFTSFLSKRKVSIRSIGLYALLITIFLVVFGFFDIHPTHAFNVKESLAGDAFDLAQYITLESIASIIAPITLIVFQFASLALGIVGLFFDFIMDKTVIDAYGSIVENDGIRTGIQASWVVIRDLVNISFIFILLYQSIMLMVGKSNEASKVIVKLVVVALLINFSMFMTRAIVDTSNIIATGFYDQIVPPNQNAFFSISSKYTQVLNVPSLFDGALEQIATEGWAKGDNYLILIRNTISTGFVLTTALVFLAAGLMLLSRYVIILFLMILSPLAFAGFIIPGTQGISKQWWQTLISQAIFAPIFMVLTWINLTVAHEMFESKSDLESLGAIFVQGGGAQAVNSNAFSALFNFVLIIGLALGSLIIARKAANNGGKSFSVVNNFIGGSALNGAAFFGRNTFGRGGAMLASNDRLKALAADENSGFKGYAAKIALKSGDKFASGTYDSRNTKLGGQVFDGDFGKSTKDSYRSRLDDGVKKEVKFAQSLGVDKDYEHEAKTSLVQAEKDLQEAREHNNEDSDTIKQLKENLEDRKKAVKNAPTIRQRKYAEKLRNSGLIKTSAKNIEASKKILKEADKGKSEKVLSDVIKEIQNEESGGGEKKEEEKA